MGPGAGSHRLPRPRIRPGARFPEKFGQRPVPVPHSFLAAAVWRCPERAAGVPEPRRQQRPAEPPRGRREGRGARGSASALCRGSDHGPGPVLCPARGLCLRHTPRLREAGMCFGRDFKAVLERPSNSHNLLAASAPARSDLTAFAINYFNFHFYFPTFPSPRVFLVPIQCVCTSLHVL